MLHQVIKKLGCHFVSVVFLLLLFLLIGSQVQADNYACADPNAKWNHDYTTWPYTGKNLGVFLHRDALLSNLFSCRTVDERANSADRQVYTFISDGFNRATGLNFVCEGGTDYALCPSGQPGQRCVRRADCESIGGICLGDNIPDAPKSFDINCATGITDKVYTFYLPNSRTLLGPARWQIIRFRCADNNSTTCWKPVPPDTPPDTPPDITPGVAAATSTEDVNLPPADSTATDTELVPTMTVSDCCRQIVPDPGIDPATGLSYEYTLNHLVQTAINIYECILCIVGALILIMLIFGAVMMMISAGNEAMVGKGKQIISAAVVGGLIVFFSFLIVNFTVKALGAKFNNVDKVEIRSQG